MRACVRARVRVCACARMRACACALVRLCACALVRLCACVLVCLCALENVSHKCINFVIRLDVANALHQLRPRKQQQHLQRMQTLAARLIDGAKKHCHLFYVKSHWLQSAARVEFNTRIELSQVVYPLCGPSAANWFVTLEQTPHSVCLVYKGPLGRTIIREFLCFLS